MGSHRMIYVLDILEELVLLLLENGAEKLEERFTSGKTHMRKCKWSQTRVCAPNASMTSTPLRLLAGLDTVDVVKSLARFRLRHFTPKSMVRRIRVPCFEPSERRSISFYNQCVSKHSVRSNAFKRTGSVRKSRRAITALQWA